MQLHFVVQVLFMGRFSQEAPQKTSMDVCRRRIESLFERVRGTFQEAQEPPQACLERVRGGCISPPLEGCLKTFEEAQFPCPYTAAGKRGWWAHKSIGDAHCEDMKIKCSVGVAQRLAAVGTECESKMQKKNMQNNNHHHQQQQKNKKDSSC